MHLFSTLLMYLLAAAVISRNCFSLATREISNIPRGPRNDDITMESIESVLQNHASLILNLQAELTTTRNELTTTKNDLTTTRNELTATKSELQTAQSRVHQLESTVQLVGKAVAFSARFSEDRDNVQHGISLGSHHTLIFNEVVTNVGQAYNPTTGLFVAPVNGTYAFFLSQAAPVQTHIYLDIAKTGVIVLDTTYAREGQCDQGSSQVTTHLVQGERVWVRQNNGSGVRGGKFTIFSGFLLQADL